MFHGQHSTNPSIALRARIGAGFVTTLLCATAVAQGPDASNGTEERRARLEEVSVPGQYVNEEEVSGLKTGVPILDTPTSLTVISRQQIDACLPAHVPDPVGLAHRRNWLLLGSNDIGSHCHQDAESMPNLLLSYRPPDSN